MISAKNKIALINAPIDTKYKDSSSLFCPPLGLLSIKAYLEKMNEEFEILLLDGMVLTQNDIIRKLNSFRPNYVGVSIQLLSYKNALQICRVSKKMDAFVFVGGHHATQMAKKIVSQRYQFIDCVICGDGENAIYRICSGEKPETIAGVVLWDKFNGKIHINRSYHMEIDEFPNPYTAKEIDFTPYNINLKQSGFAYRRGRYLRIYSHKGCRFRAEGKRCVFCGRADEGYRFFSIERYFEHLLEMNITHEDYVFDVGDDLSGNMPWLQAAVEYKKKHDFTMPQLGIFGRGDEITGNSAALLHQLGVIDITMGVESGDNGVLEESGKEINNAGVFYNAARTLFENGIGLTPSYVLGLPGENSHSLHSTISHANALKTLSTSILGCPPGEIVANLLEPIPGSSAFSLLETSLPHKYLVRDDLELEEMQRDYFCIRFNMSKRSYMEFRKELANAGRIINRLVPFADPQGWLNGEID